MILNYVNFFCGIVSRRLTVYIIYKNDNNAYESTVFKPNGNIEFLKMTRPANELILFYSSEKAVVISLYIQLLFLKKIVT